MRWDMAVKAMTSERFLAAGLALLLAACGGGGGAGDEPRHAILISIDTLRPDYLGCYDPARKTSPVLDALAADGVRFEHVTSASPWTLPSHASMLTGLYPNHHGVRTHETRLPDSVVTLAEEFKQKGYETFAVVNTHNVGGEQFALSQGFDHFRYIDETLEDQATMQLKTLNCGDSIVLTAKEMLRQRDESKPFFLFLHFYDVHTDFTPKDEFRAKFVEPYAGRLTGRTTQLVDVRKKEERLSEADVRWLKQMYEAEIRQLDELLGRFFGWLDEEGVGDETLFVVTSDHGEEFQEHGSVLHGRTYYEEVIRIPLLMKGPGLPAGTVVATPAHTIDVVPTILAHMGIPSSQARDGLDLSPTWKGGTLPERTLFSEADHNIRIDGVDVHDILKMVRKGDTKLVHDTHRKKNELYDLGRDPLEQRDLSAADAARLAELEAELARFVAGAKASEAVAPPTAEELRILEELGYGGGGD